MTAPPNATSQGSNGAGGGAFRAFVGMSAAKADPVIANIAATSTIFFITIPITFPKNQPENRRPPGPRLPDCNEFFSPEPNLKGVDQGVKPKSQASADFLSVCGIVG